MYFLQMALKTINKYLFCIAHDSQLCQIHAQGRRRYASYTAKAGPLVLTTFESFPYKLVSCPDQILPSHVRGLGYGTRQYNTSYNILKAHNTFGKAQAAD